MTIRHLVLPVLILFSLVSLQACKGKDKGATEEISKVETVFSAKSSADGLKSRDFEKYLKIDKRRVDDAEAERALKKLGLGKNGIFSWEKKTGSNGNYVFTNLSVTEKKDGELSIASLALDGVHMKDETPRFDRLTVSELVTSDKDGKFAVEQAVLVKPSLEAAAAIYEIVERLRSFKDIDEIDFEGDAPGFEAIRLNGVSAQDDDNLIEMAAFDWGTNPETEQGAMRLEDLTLISQENDEVIITLGHLGVTELDLAILRDLDNYTGKDTGSFPNRFGLGTQFFKTLSLSDFTLTTEGVHVTADALNVKTQNKGADIVSIYDMSPIVVDLTGLEDNRQNKDLREALSGLGYEKLVIRGGGESVYNPENGTLGVRNSFLELADGFRLSYDYVFGNVDDTADDPTENMTLNTLEFRLTDNSLLERVINYVAAEQKSTESLVRMQAKGVLMVASLAVEDPGQKQLVAQAAEAFAQFIDDGGTLHIAMKPETPVRVSELQGQHGQDVDVEALGLSITVQ